MPGRTPAEAFAAFVEPLQMALSCVARAKIVTSRGGRGELGRTHTLTINNGEGVQLQAEVPMVLRATMVYEIVRWSSEAQPFKISTRAYLYALAVDNVELLSAHWHPNANSPVQFPHWHIGSAALTPNGVLTPRAHLRSDRIAFEEMVEHAVELGAAPLQDDWRDRLETTRQNYEHYRSWR